MTGRMEKRGKPETGFPRFSTAPLEIAAAIPTFPPRQQRFSPFSKTKTKGAPGSDPHLLRSGSFFDEKMLLV
jgi:hypothetical protein